MTSHSSPVAGAPATTGVLEPAASDSVLPRRECVTARGQRVSGAPSTPVT